MPWQLARVNASLPSREFDALYPRAGSPNIGHHHHAESGLEHLYDDPQLVGALSCVHTWPLRVALAAIHVALTHAARITSAAHEGRGAEQEWPSPVAALEQVGLPAGLWSARPHVDMNAPLRHRRPLLLRGLRHLPHPIAVICAARA